MLLPAETFYNRVEVTLFSGVDNTMWVLNWTLSITCEAELDRSLGGGSCSGFDEAASHCCR